MGLLCTCVHQRLVLCPLHIVQHTAWLSRDVMLPNIWLKSCVLLQLLSCGPVDHEKSVGKALGERSDLAKAKKQLSEELAETLGRALAAEEGHVHHMHRCVAPKSWQALSVRTLALENALQT
jgi:hypothetical protein